MLLLFLCILNSKDLQSFPLPFFGALLDLFRIFMRFLDMKYGFWRDPSFRSKSSTVEGGNVKHVGVNSSFSASVSQRRFRVYSQKQRKSVSTHMLYTLKNP